MRVLLTSTGLETEEIKECFVDMAGKDMSLIKALFIPTAAIDADAIGVLPKCMNDLLKCGILAKNIDVFDLHAGMGVGKLQQYDVVYLCGGNTQYLLERINATGFNKSLKAYIKDNGLVIGVSAGSLIFSNNLDNNLGLIDTKLDVHCIKGEKRGKLAYPLKNNVKLTNTSALVIRDFPDGVEIIGDPDMEKRKEINDRLVKWILNKVKTEYADDISLVLIYGSYINGTANGRSDVDCYYIPKTERGYGLAVDFIIEGVGYDIFPVSWERVEKIADLLDNLSPLVGDVDIIYCNSASDAERFRTMQKRLQSNLSNDEYVKEIAARRCEEAGKLCAMLEQSHNASKIRKIAGGVIMTLADAVAVYHHDYYHFGLKKQFEDLQNNFPAVPRDIITGYQKVIEATDIDDVIKYTMDFSQNVCGYLNVTYAAQEISEDKDLMVSKVDVSYLAPLYEEISSTFNKIYVCCETGNYVLAFLSAVCLQWDLDEAKEAGCPGYELLSDFNYKELGRFSETARRIEDELVQLITDNGGHIRKYDSFEEFEAAKL